MSFSNLTKNELEDAINFHKTMRNRSAGGVNSVAHAHHDKKVKEATAEWVRRNTITVKEELTLNQEDELNEDLAKIISDKLNKAKVSYRDPNKKIAQDEDKLAKRLAVMNRFVKKESVDEGKESELTELSKGTLKSYLDKAQTDRRKKENEIDKQMDDEEHYSSSSPKYRELRKDTNQKIDRLQRRYKGIDRATDKLSESEVLSKKAYD